MAIKSGLATSDVQAAVGNYTKGRSGKKVGKITIHHAVMAKCTGKRIAQVFTNPNRNASANYCIGYTRGDICCSLYEENRAWTSSSAANDNVAITMEVANSSTQYPYPVSDDTLANIIDLCVDICQRYNFRLTWTGDKNGTLTVHRMFANTACPGDYLYNLMPYIAEEVNKRLDKKPTPTPTPSPKVYTKGTYRLNEAKYIRKTPALGNNYTLVKETTQAMRSALTSTNPNAKAKVKAGTIFTVLSTVTEPNGRIWAKNYSGFICIQNVDGHSNVTKVS